MFAAVKQPRTSRYSILAVVLEVSNTSTKNGNLIALFLRFIKVTFSIFSLVEWLNHSKKKYCELCKHPFTFSPIYAPQMPSRIPFSVLILGSIKFAAKLVKRSLSFIFAAFLWGFLVPMVSAQIFRYYFGFSLQGLLNLAPLRLAVEFSSPEELQQYVFESAIYLLFDVVQGLLICGFTVFLGLGLLLTRELQTMIQPTTETPAQNQAGETASDIEDAPVAENENIRPTNVRFRSLANQPPVEVASTLNSTLAGRTPPPPQSPMADESSFSPRQSSIFSPQAQQLFSEIARLEEALNGTGSSEASTSSGNSGGYWLDRVHPKEYKKYVQRSNLQRQMMAASQGGSPDVPPADFTTAADDSFSFWSSPNFDDHLSNISATTTLRTNATAQTNSNFDSIRCRICSSTTCINRDHVIQASRLRFAAVAARNQALINESLEFGGFNTPSTSTSQTNQSPPAPVAENALTNSTNSETANNTDDTAPVRPGLVRRRQPAQPEQQPQPQQQQQQPQREEEDWRFNLDADSITLAEFFGFSAEGANPIELFQNAAIVTGCNALVMIVFLCIPCLFGSIILKVTLIF